MELEATNQLPDNMRGRIHKLIGCLRLRQANVEFYIHLLCYFSPDDEIFQKSYKYVKIADVPIEPVISNEDGLFTDLPPLSEREIRSTNRMRMPKEMTLHLKM